MSECLATLTAWDFLLMVVRSHARNPMSIAREQSKILLLLLPSPRQTRSNSATAYSSLEWALGLSSKEEPTVTKRSDGGCLSCLSGLHRQNHVAPTVVM